MHASANAGGYRGNTLAKEQQFVAQMNQMNKQSKG